MRAFDKVTTPENFGPVTVTVADDEDPVGRPIHKRPTFTLPLRDAICRPCNNAKLGPLEKETQPILEPMIVDAAPAILDAGAQKVLATWAFKTALLLERAARWHYGADRTVQGYESSDAELAWLWANREPAPRARVWIGAFDAQNRMKARHSVSNVTAYGRDASELPAHLTTFTCGYVAFQVFSTDFVIADAIEVLQFPGPPAGIDLLFEQLWPARTLGPTINWPKHVFGLDHWQMVSTWPQRAPRQMNVLRMPG
jgi:hypothetical protein